MKGKRSECCGVIKSANNYASRDSPRERKGGVKKGGTSTICRKVRKKDVWLRTTGLEGQRPTWKRKNGGAHIVRSGVELKRRWVGSGRARHEKEKGICAIENNAAVPSTTGEKKREEGKIIGMGIQTEKEKKAREGSEPPVPVPLQP